MNNIHTLAWEVLFHHIIIISIIKMFIILHFVKKTANTSDISGIKNKTKQNTLFPFCCVAN